MSINAYPVFNNRMGKVSFSLYRDRELTDFLDMEVDIYRNIHDCSGTIEIPLMTLLEAAGIAKELYINERTKQRLRSNIEYARKHNNKVITYYCF